jgi:hypothetical protein
MQNETQLLAALNPQIIATLETTLAEGWKSFAAEQPAPLDEPKRRRTHTKRKPKE